MSTHYSQYLMDSNHVAVENEYTTNSSLSESMIIQQLQQLLREQPSLSSQPPSANHSSGLLFESIHEFIEEQAQLKGRPSSATSMPVVTSTEALPSSSQNGLPSWTPDSSYDSQTDLPPWTSDTPCYSQNDFMAWTAEASLLPTLTPETSFYSHDDLLAASASFRTLHTDSMTDLADYHPQQQLQNYSSYSLASTAHQYAYFEPDVCNYQNSFSTNATALHHFYDPSYLINDFQPITVMPPSMSSFIRPTKTTKKMSDINTMTPKKSISTGCTRRQRQKKLTLSQRKMSAMDLKSVSDKETGSFHHNSHSSMRPSLKGTTTTTSSMSNKTSYKKGRNVEKACNHCKRSHLRCDNLRPCGRCVATGKNDCHDVEHKARGRPRGPKK
ncbi:hypothetical protein BDF20DRAFT_875374 [Mycotypha africana]|uniref:uncharacterized protein n=1 Tax=Mycotypha africana TaxID=64632 RepID=UPI002300AFB5|nr:uncharacterized protein BDF20DRAFT_875374 [Mycotypha africana]KAI8977530.1 hypothetical protein BDF20DRAFT_875374 [Mycotypha africana]